MSQSNLKKGPSKLPKNSESNKPHPSEGHLKEDQKNITPLFCKFKDCKTSPKRLEFCDPHYEYFKFGLIKKTGQPVSDYEKKLEHFLAYQKKQRVQKAA